MTKSLVIDGLSTIDLSTFNEDWLGWSDIRAPKCVDGYDHDFQPTDSQGHSMECANGCGAMWSLSCGVSKPDDKAEYIAWMNAAEAYRQEWHAQLCDEAINGDPYLIDWKAEHEADFMAASHEFGEDVDFAQAQWEAEIRYENFHLGMTPDGTGMDYVDPCYRDDAEASWYDFCTR